MESATAPTSTLRNLLRELKFSTFDAMLSRYAAEHGADVFVRILSDANPDKERALTYGEIWDLSRAAAAALQQKGLKKGEKVVLVLPTGIDFISMFFGTILAGGIPVPAYPPAGLGKFDEYLERLSGVIESSEASYLCATRSVANVVGQVLQRCQSLRELIVAAQLKGEAASFSPVKLDPEDTVLLQYTSGSTGAQKGVELSHQAILANMHAIGLGLGIREGVEVGLSWLPLNHDMGLIGGLLSALYWRVHYVLMSPQSFIGQPKRWLWAMHKYKVNISPAPNFAYELCAKRVTEEEVQGLDLSHWRIALNGAEPVSFSALEAFTARFAKHGFRSTAFFPVYGLAETSLAAAFPVPETDFVVDEVSRPDLETKALATPAKVNGIRTQRMVSVGRAIWGTEIRVVDESGRPLPERRIGELQLRSLSMMKGYYKNPEATAKAFRDGWLCTGDLAYAAGGDFYIAGRIKDLIIKRGRNYYPQDLERAVERVPGVRAGCTVAFAVYNEGEGTEDVVVLAETRLTGADEQKALAAEVEKALMTAVGLRPDALQILPPHTLPKTTSGKIQRRKARQLYVDRALRTSGQVGLLSSLSVLGKSYLARVRHQLGRRSSGPDSERPRRPGARRAPGTLVTELAFRRPLVVGGTGFVGLNIAQALQERGLEVRITRRASSITFAPRKLKLPMVEASLDDEESLCRAMSESDVVFLAAAHYPRWSVNKAEQIAYGVAGVRRALNAARRAKVQKLIYTSSVTTVGPAPFGRPANESDAWVQEPDSVYFALKLAMEREVLRAAEEGFPAVVVCPSGCLGRYDVKAGTGFFLVALARGKLPYVVDGLLDMVGVEDVAQAHVAAMARGQVGRRYIIAANAVGARELLTRAAQKLGVEAPKKELGLSEALALNLEQEARCAAARKGAPDIPVEFLDMIRFGQRFDARRARDELGFAPAGLEEVLDRACAWFQKSGYLGRKASEESPRPASPKETH